MKARFCLNLRATSLRLFSPENIYNCQTAIRRQFFAASSIPSFASRRITPSDLSSQPLQPARHIIRSRASSPLQRVHTYNQLAQSSYPRESQQRRKSIESQISPAFYFLPLFAAGAYLIYATILPATSDTSESKDNVSETVSDDFDFEMMDLPGRLGNLTPEQEEKMFQLWKLLLQVSGVMDDESTAEASDAPVPLEARGTSSTTESGKPKKKRLGIFKKKDKKDKKDNPQPAASEKTAALDGVKDDDPDDKYGQNKQFRDTLANRSPESIRESIWTMVKMDHPDQLVLRFLRARKWDVQKALVMLISTMKWRQDVKVDEDIMARGEEWALLEERNATDENSKKFARDFLAQMRLGKSFCRGVDKAGRPISVIRVRLHKQGEQSNESLERYTIYLIETARMMLVQPVDTACVIFDMTGFSMANMDYTPLKFMIQCFEANYPESLGVVLVHKAPWIFQGIWKVIRGWLDPVVASKVNFTNNFKEMAEFVPAAKVSKDLEGEDEWTYEYVEPIIGENEKMKDTTTRDKLLEARDALYEEYEQKTLEWIQEKDTAKRAAIKSERNSIAQKLREGYWVLDPYVRARSYYDRVGVLKPGGAVNHYASEKPSVNGTAAAASSTPAVAEPNATTTTTADDVD